MVILQEIHQKTHPAVARVTCLVILVKISIVASIASQTRAPQLGSDGSGSFQKGDKMTLV